MNLRLVSLAMVLGMLALVAWHSELYTVERSGALPVPLRALPVEARRAAVFDASLPLVPAGVERVAAGDGVVLVHYWAPWERHSGAQALGLDSLRRALPPGALRLAVVCFDPYPSVARYVARLRLRLPVMLDLHRALADQLPCPSLPYTYLVDRRGRIAVEQSGEIDWLAPETRATLQRVLAEPTPSRDAERAAS